MGIFSGFIKDAEVGLIGVEASGEGLEKRHAATMTKGRPGVPAGGEVMAIRALLRMLQDRYG